MHERKPRYLFQFTTSCPKCKRDNISVNSTDLEAGLLWSLHFYNSGGRFLSFCESSGLSYEPSKVEKS